MLLVQKPHLGIVDIAPVAQGIEVGNRLILGVVAVTFGNMDLGAQQIAPGVVAVGNDPVALAVGGKPVSAVVGVGDAVAVLVGLLGDPTLTIVGILYLITVAAVKT